MPRIGLLSDSHGRAMTTRRAVSTLLAEQIDVMLHLGDIGTVEVIDALTVENPKTGKQLEVHLVFGNTDWDIPALHRYALDLDLNVDHPVGTLTLDKPEQGGKLVFCHGHEPIVMQDALSQGVRYLCHGHTHRSADDRVGQTRVINPGALFRAREYTVAVLDTRTNQLTFHPVAD